MVILGHTYLIRTEQYGIQDRQKNYQLQST